MAVRIKLEESSYKNVKEELEKMENQFSKTDNKMLAFDLISKGEMTGQVTKAHLINIIKVLCKNLDWTDDEQIESLETVVQNQDDESTGNSNVNPENLNAQHVRSDLKNEVCKRKSIPDSHDNVQRRKEKVNHWYVLKGNLHSAKNRKASLSKNLDAKVSSLPKNSEVYDGNSRSMEEDKKVSSAVKINSSYGREERGCGPKLCTIL